MTRPTKEQLEQELARNEERASRILDRLARIEDEPEDDFDEGALITFDTTKYLSESGGMGMGTAPRNLTYAAIKVGSNWYVTGKYTRPITWDRILELADGSVISWASEVTEL